MKNLRQEFWTRGVEFIQVELNLGLTFSSIALSGTNSERSERNMRNAKASYDVVKRFLPLVRLSKIESQMIEQKCSVLQQRFAEFSELQNAKALESSPLDPKQFA